MNEEHQITLFPDNAEYDAFTEKFKPKKTTDDCYTPPNIYAVVADWVAHEYGLDKDKFLRPFKPGGDYEHEAYPDGWTVVDNPPFSIMKSICTFYNERGVDFFLFCPALTPPNVEGVTIIATGSDITYENGASVSTSFVTNMQPDIVLRSAPKLYKAIEETNKVNLFLQHRNVPKYEYPDHVITAADRAAADRAAADRAAVWELSARELAVVQCLESGEEIEQQKTEEDTAQTSLFIEEF